MLHPVSPNMTQPTSKLGNIGQRTIKYHHYFSVNETDWMKYGSSN